MRKFILSSLMLMAASMFLFLGGCRKDDLNKEKIIKSLKSFRKISTWNQSEKQFFKINEKTNTVNRNKQAVNCFNPLIMASYDYLVNENEKFNFVEEISSKVGNPKWENSAVFYNRKDRTNATLIPLVKNGQNKVNGIISINIIEGKIIVNAYLQSNVNASLKSDCNYYFIAEHFANFESKMFNSSVSPVQMSRICECKENNTPTLINLPPDCEWNLVELCTDSRSNTTWQNGQIAIYPPHLDHDRDGIHNDDDQDWPEWLDRRGLTASEFEVRIRNWWIDNQYIKHGNYDEFWEEIDENIWEKYDEEDHGGSLNTFDWIFDLLDFFDDLFGDFFDWIGDTWDSFIDWIIFWDEVSCPDISDNPMNNEILENRVIKCDWYYIKSCNDDFNWWEDFDIKVDCPIMSHLQSSDVQKLSKYLNSTIQDNPCTGLPLNKEDYIEQICDNYGYLSNDQNFVSGGVITPEIELVLAYETIKDFLEDYPNDPKAAQLAKDLKSTLCSGTTIGTIESEVNRRIDQFENTYYDNVDSGQEYDLGGGFDWSKHSPVSSQSLPSYNGFYSSYPKDANGKLLTGAANIFGLLSGPIQQIYVDYPNIENVCALKVSIALNGAGVNIPHIFQDDNSNGIKDSGEKSITIPDDNGKYYFLNAEMLINYMLTVFPSPTLTVTSTDITEGATPESSFGTNSGIYGMLPVNATTFEASGHCDIWLPVAGSSPVYNVCGAGCYWQSVDVAYLWKLN